MGFITFEVACKIDSPVAQTVVPEETKEEPFDMTALTYIILYFLLTLILIVLIMLLCKLTKQEKELK